MSSLSGLTATQIQAIATALAAAPTPAPTDGAALYTSYCSSCHSALAGSSVRGSSASTISSALSSVSQMRSISLTTTQIQAIATALGTTPTSATSASGTIDGAALYTQYCSGCHGSDKKGSSVSSIQSAISSVSQMRSLSAHERADPGHFNREHGPSADNDDHDCFRNDRRRRALYAILQRVPRQRQKGIISLIDSERHQQRESNEIAFAHERADPGHFNREHGPSAVNDDHDCFGNDRRRCALYAILQRVPRCACHERPQRGNGCPDTDRHQHDQRNDVSFYAHGGATPGYLGCVKFNNIDDDIGTGIDCMRLLPRHPAGNRPSLTPRGVGRDCRAAPATERVTARLP